MRKTASFALGMVIILILLTACSNSNYDMDKTQTPPLPPSTSGTHDSSQFEMPIYEDKDFQVSNADINSSQIPSNRTPSIMPVAGW